MPESQKTDPVDPGATGGDAPTATNPNGAGSATGDDEHVKLSREDYNNLIAARDRANESARSQEEFLTTLAKEREIKSFLEENKDTYPDLSLDDLMVVDDPEMLEPMAKKLQRRVEDLVQKKLSEVQNPSTPHLSEEDRQKQIDSLRNSGDPQAFEKMVELRMSR